MNVRESGPVNSSMRRILVGAAAGLLAACTTPIVPDPSVDLTGDWEITAVGREPTGGGENFILSFDPPSGWAQFGCNAGGGSARIERGWLVTGDWIVTVAGCIPKERMRFEREGFEILSEPLAIERRSDRVIRLRNSRGSIDLQPLAPPQLAGSRWSVVGINGRPPPAEAMIRFEARTFVANFGCNSMRGAYEQVGVTLRSPGSTTEMGCMAPDGRPGPVMEYEEQGFAILGRPTQIERVRPGAIRLANERGEILLEENP
jgi:heat shock protein HslJ